MPDLRLILNRHIIYIYIYIYIENADATPPHLDVILRLGSSGDLLVSVVFDRWVAHEYVCDYKFLTRFQLIFNV